MVNLTLKELLDAGVHFGHQTRRWNPKMKPYIFMERNGIYIIDLEKSLQAMEAAREAVRKAVGRGEAVLFVATKKQAKSIVTEEAQRCGMYHVTERWLGGMLTNFQTIRQSIRYLRNLERMEEDGTMAKLSKKEASRLSKQRAKLEKNFSGIKEMHKLPGLMFIIDTKREHIAVRESQRLGIPSVAVVDTNADPDDVTHPIPGNDDAIRAIELYTRFIGDTVLEARASAPPPAEREAASEPIPETTGRGSWSSDYPPRR
ncbi:MAG: 30S ribosomal protein S2 [Candidatus Eisenbacteria bacterium]|nr:30S ribosomal protein S2 [Candidatus Eisenbacteria bacterium]